MRRSRARRIRLGAGFLGLGLAVGAVALAWIAPEAPSGARTAEGLALGAREALARSDAAPLALLLLGAGGLAAAGRRRRNPA